MCLLLQLCREIGVSFFKTFHKSLLVSLKLGSHVYVWVKITKFESLVDIDSFL